MTNTTIAQQSNGNRLTALEKTPEDRAKELESLLVEAKAKGTMPEDVAKICDLLSGQSFKLGSKSLVSIPPTAQWNSYEGKKGATAGKMIYTCLGRFAPVAFGNIGKRHISIQIQVAILPVSE